MHIIESRCKVVKIKKNKKNLVLIVQQVNIVFKWLSMMHFITNEIKDELLLWNNIHVHSCIKIVRGLFIKGIFMSFFLIRGLQISPLHICSNQAYCRRKEQSWLGWYGSWIYNYICNQCLSSLTLWLRIPLMARYAWHNRMW